MTAPPTQWIIDPNHPTERHAVEAVPTALLSGFAVYTTLLGTLTLDWQACHLQRLADNANAIGIRWEFNHNELSAHIQAVHTAEHPIVRLTAYPVSMTDNTGFCLISIRPIPQKKNANGLTLQRIDFCRPLPMIKWMNLGELLYFRHQAGTQGFDDIVLTNSMAHITELSTASFFAWDDTGQLWTPSPERDGCLPGITAKLVQHCCRELAIPVRQDKPLSIHDVKHWQAAFSSNAVSGVQAIAGINRQDLPWPPWYRDQFCRLQGELKKAGFLE